MWRAHSPIGEDVRSLGQITPELLVYVCARSLLLISEGSMKVSESTNGSTSRVCVVLGIELIGLVLFIFGTVSCATARGNRSEA